MKGSSHFFLKSRVLSVFCFLHCMYFSLIGESASRGGVV